MTVLNSISADINHMWSYDTVRPGTQVVYCKMKCN